MKVLFTLDTLGGGGTEASTLDLINNFSHRSIVTVCYFYNQHDLKNEYLKGSCNLVYLDLPGRYSFIEGISKLLKLVRQEMFDLIVTSLYRASIMSRMVSLLTGVPLIDTMVNESYGKEKKKEFEGFNICKFRMVQILDRLTSFIPKLWISNSQFLANSLGRQLCISGKKIKVIYRGRYSHEITAWRSDLNGGFHFISIGRLFKQKAQDDLISTFYALHQKFPQSYLTIYGEGPERANLDQLILDLDLAYFISLPGRKENAWKELYRSHCFVLPSRYEGFSGALIEALMAGIPAIASDIPVNKEAIVNYKTGLLFKVNDTDDLLVKMEEVITHYNAAVIRGQAARQEALEKYDIRKIAAEYETILQQCAAKVPGHQ